MRPRLPAPALFTNGCHFTLPYKQLHPPTRPLQVKTRVALARRAATPAVTLLDAGGSQHGSMGWQLIGSRPRQCHWPRRYAASLPLQQQLAPEAMPASPTGRGHLQEPRCTCPAAAQTWLAWWRSCGSMRPTWAPTWPACPHVRAFLACWLGLWTALTGSLLCIAATAAALLACRLCCPQLTPTAPADPRCLLSLPAVPPPCPLAPCPAAEAREAFILRTQLTRRVVDEQGWDLQQAKDDHYAALRRQLGYPASSSDDSGGSSGEQGRGRLVAAGWGHAMWANAVLEQPAVG